MSFARCARTTRSHFCEAWPEKILVVMLNKVSSPRSPKKLCKFTIYLQSNQSLCPCLNSIILTTFIRDNSFVQEHKLGIDISIQAEQKSILRYKLVKCTSLGAYLLVFFHQFFLICDVLAIHIWYKENTGLLTVISSTQGG